VVGRGLFDDGGKWQCYRNNRFLLKASSAKVPSTSADY